MLSEKPKLFKVITWEIQNFTQEWAENYPTETKIESQVFRLRLQDADNKTDHHVDMVIQLYPNGRLESGRGNLSVYIKSIKAATNKTLKICFDHRSRIKLFIKPVNELLDGWGYPKFISHAQLFGSCKRMFADGKLIIRCEISEANDAPPSAPADSMNVQIMSDFKGMFENESLSDFQVEANDGEILMIHKSIVAARSPVFFAMFTQKMKEERENFVSIPDFDSKVLKELFRFVYCFEVECSCEIACDLIFAAEKYNIGLLKVLCLDRIISTLEVENVPAALMVAHRIEGSENLYDECLKLVMSDAENIVENEEWKKLPNEVITQVLVDFAKRAPHTFIEVKTA